MEDSKKYRVRRMFDTIAPSYDRLNHLLSFNVDRAWRRKVVEQLAKRHPNEILDLATGTADLAIAMAERMPTARIIGADLSEQMLAAGAEKVTRLSLQGRISLERADAEELPMADASFDAVTVAFGVRNFENIEAGLSQMYRVLRPGGMCVILEFSHPDGKIFSSLYRFYFHRILPFVGGVISRDRAAYRYLPDSVDSFPEPDRFCSMAVKAGFGAHSATKLSLGIAYMYYFEK